MQLRLSPFILAFLAARNELVEEQLRGAGRRAGGQALGAEARAPGPGRHSRQQA